MLRQEFNGASGADHQDRPANQALPLLKMVREHVDDLNTSALSEVRAYHERLQSHDPTAFDWDQWPEPDVGSAGTVLPFSTVQSVFRKIMSAVNDSKKGTHGMEADINSIEFLNYCKRHSERPDAEAQAGFPTASLRLTFSHDDRMIDIVALKDRRELLLLSQDTVVSMGDYSHFRDGAAFEHALLNRLPRDIGNILKDIMYPDEAKNRSLHKGTAPEIHEPVLHVTP